MKKLFFVLLLLIIQIAPQNSCAELAENIKDENQYIQLFQFIFELDQFWISYPMVRHNREKLAFDIKSLESMIQQNSSNRNTELYEIANKLLMRLIEWASL
jgi:hypothetical protein